MKLVIKSPVWDDLRRIMLRIAQDNPPAADRFFVAAKKTFDFLKHHPAAGRLRTFSVAGIRSWMIPGFRKYLIFYLPTAAEVQILAVLHGMRDLPAVLEDRLE